LAATAAAVANRSPPSTRTTGAPVRCRIWRMTSLETAPVPPTTTTDCGASRSRAEPVTGGSTSRSVRRTGPPARMAAGAAARASGNVVPVAMNTAGTPGAKLVATAAAVA
jgi:hypothetical protein